LESILSIEKMPKQVPEFAHLNNLKVYRELLHETLIKYLKELYGKETWKYEFIKNVKEKFNQKIQYKQINEFEAGNSRNENLLHLIMLEIISKKSEISMKVISEGADFIKIKIE
jgi:hypothetical protein